MPGLIESEPSLLLMIPISDSMLASFSGLENVSGNMVLKEGTASSTAGRSESGNKSVVSFDVLDTCGEMNRQIMFQKECFFVQDKI